VSASCRAPGSCAKGKENAELGTPRRPPDRTPGLLVKPSAFAYFASFCSTLCAGRSRAESASRSLASLRTADMARYLLPERLHLGRAERA